MAALVLMAGSCSLVPWRSAHACTPLPPMQGKLRSMSASREVVQDSRSPLVCEERLEAGTCSPPARYFQGAVPWLVIDVTFAESDAAAGQAGPGDWVGSSSEFRLKDAAGAVIATANPNVGSQIGFDRLGASVCALVFDHDAEGHAIGDAREVCTPISVSAAEWPLSAEETAAHEQRVDAGCAQLESPSESTGESTGESAGEPAGEPAGESAAGGCSSGPRPASRAGMALGEVCVAALGVALVLSRRRRRAR